MRFKVYVLGMVRCGKYPDPVHCRIGSGVSHCCTTVPTVRALYAHLTSSFHCSYSVCELVSGADTVDSDEVCAVVFREIGVCESATSATSAKRGKGKGESATSAKVCGA